MRLTRDYDLTLTAPRETETCRIRLFVPSESDLSLDTPVVVCTTRKVREVRDSERATDPASEAPDALSPERVAAEVMLAHELEEFVWISHELSPEEAFYLVVFSHHEVRGIVREDGVWRREIGQPTWKPLDRENVVSLTGIQL